jgi:hypothetical protein
MSSPVPNLQNSELNPYIFADIRTEFCPSRTKNMEDNVPLERQWKCVFGLTVTRMNADMGNLTCNA